MNFRIPFLVVFSLLLTNILIAQKKKKRNAKANTNISTSNPFQEKNYAALKWRNIGPFRGGRSNAAVGVLGDPQKYYFGSVGGGVWKTTDAGITWSNISDGFFNTNTIGAIAIAPSDQNVIYVGTGEHAVRGVMSSHGDGMYKSTDAGKTWKHIGLKDSRHIAKIVVHPDNPDWLYVAVQGSVWKGSKQRGIYQSKDGGISWDQLLFVDEYGSAADLSMDANNSRILYATIWDNQRLPWQIRSGGPNSSIYKSTDAGATWKKVNKGLPDLMGKIAVDVSPANSERLYANVEAEGEKGGVYRSDDAGDSWKQVNKDRVTVARAWYYIEIFADPKNEDIVYVLNAPMLKSTDGGKTFIPIPNPHSDQHDLWINPSDPNNIILANDGGACITFNGGQSWSSQNNQPTAQFYRVIADNQFPYHVYGGQQDNSTVCIASSTNGSAITDKDWYPVAGGESAFIAFNNPDNPQKIYGTTIQGFIDVYDKSTRTTKDIMAYPSVNLGSNPDQQKYRFNWNGPLAHDIVNPQIIYHGANKLLQSKDGGYEWTEISPDLTRNDSDKHSAGGIPFTNEAAGGEIYNTISYIASSPHQEGQIWIGTDDGLVHLTNDGGKNWMNISPKITGESLINAIEVSPHDQNKAYLAVTKYKYDDHTPMIYKTKDQGKTWISINKGIPSDNFVRVVREDNSQPGLLYAGTERGLYISFNDGSSWQPFQSNLPLCPITDLYVKDNDLIAATSGRSFWILDDVGALQTSKERMDSTSMQLFKPSTTYKFSLSQEKNSKFNGQNPMPGVIIDYYLPNDFVDSSDLKLEILDANGMVLRTMTNKKNKKFKSWPGGPPKPSIIPSKPHLNRMSWDMRRDAMPAVEGLFVLGGYNGSKVGPGNYTVRLTQGDLVQTEEFKIEADPRVKATAVEYAAQQDLLSNIESTVKDIYESVNEFRSVKKQLSAQLEFIKEEAELKTLNDKGTYIMKALKDWEGQVVQAKQKTFQDVINFENKLNSQLMMLQIRIDETDPKPTSGVRARLKALMTEWDVHKTTMNKIIDEDISEFNQLYKEADLPALILKTKKEIKP